MMKIVWPPRAGDTRIARDIEVCFAVSMKGLETRSPRALKVTKGQVLVEATKLRIKFPTREDRLIAHRTLCHHQTIVPKLSSHQSTDSNNAPLSLPARMLY